MFSEVGGAGDVAFAGFEMGFAKFLQVGGLGVNEEFVDAGNREILDESEVDAHAEAGEEVHGFLGADGLGGAEEAVRAGDLIV